MSAINIYTLPSTERSTSSDAASIRQDIEKGLVGSSEPTIPGKRPEDRRWSFSRSVPTVVLYDEQGLRLYDNITSKAHEYYLFEDELNLLKTHGDEIARSMGFPGKGRKDKEHHTPHYEEKRWRQAKWGDTEVGKWNMGVNGEQGLGGGWERGYDVVELGAGALRKTAHLLKALSSALPPPPANASDLPEPITYHPLDLSHPELHRVLGEMDEAYGKELNGKVSCIGLHGDYEAGLQMIRDGKLHELRGKYFGAHPDEDVISLASSSPVQGNVPIHKLDLGDDGGSASPPLTANSNPAAEVVRPEDLTSPVPSAITDESSEVSKNDLHSSGTWSPIENSSPDREGEAPISRPLHYLFLGSSLGNFDRASAAPFLKSLPLKPGDTLLLGLDGRPPPGEEGRKKVEMAYNDPAGHTRAFEEHGWDVVKQEMGINEGPGVEFVGRYNEEMGRHEAYFRSKGKQTIKLSHGEVTLDEGELLNIEWSFKYSHLEALELFDQADLRVVNSWKAPDSEYRLWVLERPPVRFSRSELMTKDLKVGEKKNVPKWEEWQELWRLWDHITLAMCPEKMLHTKPIDLRHICLFYLGHIPTFLDIYLTRLTGGKHTEPEFFKDIFERGIDPDVDDPTKIHAHSEVPIDQADWPSLPEVLAFRDRVRARLRGIYDDLESGKMAFTQRAGRVLFMGYEHEAQHAETLLYMLAQSLDTEVPGPTPEWSVLVQNWVREENKVLSVPGRTITLGHDDPEQKDGEKEGWSSHEFGWDEESPAHEVEVKGFKADALPITNQEYRDFLDSDFTSSNSDSDSRSKSIPASWIEVDGKLMVRSFYGPLDFSIAANWPLMASKIEIEAFARSKGGRLPTEAELRVLWEHEDGPRVDGESANIGFRNWHPVPPTLTKVDNSGRKMYGHNGGVWEWTSTPLAGYPDYVPSELYPGYSADFFDGKHFVVIGGSYATIPQIASRKSFRNWYQANYPYSFIGGRVVYDA